jgi:3-oxocholest-4-en-26-oyl-CoA dehydrogenase beta subunit
VCTEALRQAAEYTNQREQFERPLATFQGAQIRAADAYIDTEAIRVTTQQAAWKMDAGRDASADVLVAKWWASEAGQHAVHNTQHLHGGMGADIDYPVHRYFLWGKQIEDTLGGASATLARLGSVLATATTGA